LKDVADIVAKGEFKAFREVVESGGRIKALAVPGGAVLSRKEIDDLTGWVRKGFRARGLPWLKHEAGGLRSSLSKFFDEGQLARLAERCQTNEGDIIFFAADRSDIAHATLGNLRLKMANRFELIPEDVWSLLWVRDFPLFERNPETGELVSVHHPFTSPQEESLEILRDTSRFEDEGEKILSRAYDLVLNGVEIGGGSIRIHDQEVQSAVFRALSISNMDARRKFGFLLDALKYGAPPHGGIAFGMDRILMLVLKRNSIREVIAFPKTQKGACMMSDSPGAVDAEQLSELGIKLMS
jgi:aspartyl-tRNA synthetase